MGDLLPRHSHLNGAFHAFQQASIHSMRVFASMSTGPSISVPIEEHRFVARAQVPGGIELRLVQHGEEFTIITDRTELMSTRISASEAALATIASEKLGHRAASQWLIGGYGMGFTLRAALAALDEQACVTVVELVPEIIEWALGPMRTLTADCLDDARVMLINEDASTLIDGARSAYDAILLDVDNGPEGLTQRANDGLYSSRGLQAAHRALKQDGILAVRSASADDGFVARLRSAGFAVDEVHIGDGAGAEGDIHVLWFARKGI